MIKKISFMYENMYENKTYHLSLCLPFIKLLLFTIHYSTFVYYSLSYFCLVFKIISKQKLFFKNEKIILLIKKWEQIKDVCCIKH